MKTKTLIEVIKENLNRKEDKRAAKLIKELKGVKERGFLNPEEFIKIGMWKSPRPKKLYLSSTEERIISISKKAFATNFEKKKIELLAQLKGVSIPTASAILTLTDPKDYGVIDIRTWQTLYNYGVLKKNPSGVGFNSKDWYHYLKIIRYYSRKLNVPTRTIELILFYHHKNNQKGRLYKQ